jgi:hypothetical protein
VGYVHAASSTGVVDLTHGRPFVLRRALAAALLAAASLALAPGTASAAPGQEPPQNTFRAFYAVSGLFEFPGGRQGSYLLSEQRDASQDGWSASLHVTTWTYGDCGGWPCQENFLTGQATLDADDVDFSRNLSHASVTDVPVVLQEMGWSWPGGLTYTDVEEIVVSLRVVGSGAIDRIVYHGDLCGDGQTACQAMRIVAERAVTGTVTVGGDVATTATTIQYVQVAETAPKATEGGTQPLPPADGGAYPTPPADSTQYPAPPADGSTDYPPPPPPPLDGSDPLPPVSGSESVPTETTADTGSLEVGAPS